MSDPSFDHQIARLFAEPPPMSDAAAFTQSIQRRLERGWRLRRTLIGLAGAVGGLIAAGQVVGANLMQRASEASRTADTRAHDVAAEWLARTTTVLHLGALPVGGEALWMIAGLAALGVGLAAARLMDAF